MKSKLSSFSHMVKFILLLVIIPLFGFAQKLKYGQIFQQPSSPFGISVIHDDRSKMVLPIGVYRVPNSSYLFWSPKKGTPYFGLVGALVQNQVATTQMKEKASEEAIFGSVNLDTITNQILKEKLQSPPNYFLASNSNEINTLTVRTCAWIIITDNNYVLTFEIETYFFNESGSKKWKGLYGYAVPDAKPLFGDGGLLENNGELLNQLANTGIGKCIDALLRDLKGKDAQWANDINIPKEAGELPKGSVLLEETAEDWIINRALEYRMGFFVSIVSKNSDRLLLHTLRKEIEQEKKD